ncbi:hypothetical protein TREES_T100014680 [Tupaia chinensis]|uniref:Required for excision 1-B domain-containing protein n=1 Tax=Tupaia chinensis TaxID=246437 RepID=L9KXD7_TUPCH|nr:hypothetical protein TREES_T100014680 [Tupaia chinensis]
MITTEAAAELAVPAVPSDAPADTGVPGREEPAWPWKDAPIRTLVQRIHQLQAERAQAFRRLEEGHRQYLRSGPPHDFPTYRRTGRHAHAAFLSAFGLTNQHPLSGASAPNPRLLRKSPPVALLQLMGAPELMGQEDQEQMQQLKMKVIKTMEEISEVLQDLRFDAESAQ